MKLFTLFVVIFTLTLNLSCRQKAERANTEFTFKASVKCSAVPVCLAQTKPVEQ
jgi:hypothetical protein